MEDFLQMLQKARGDHTGEILEGIGKTTTKKYAKELEHIYVKSLTRIFKVIDKLSAGPITNDTDIKSRVTEILPDENQPKKSFSIGDRVVIGCSYRHFKYVQKKVPAWKKSMRNLRLQPGIVTDQNTTKDTTVQVYFPGIFSSCAISVAVLEIDQNPEELVERSRWRVGDYVQTKSHKKVVKSLMQRLPDIPERFVGKPGRVIAVTSAGIFVTYDGLRSYPIDSALLQASSETRIEINEKVHPRDIRPGDKVKVISQLRKLIENQKGRGGWNRKMCCLAGKEGYITDINDDGTVDVSCGFGRGWRMNHESLLKMDELEALEDGVELDFNPADKVRVKMGEDIRMHLISKNIPLTFLEYLLVVGEVKSIDDDFDVWTTFNSTSQTCLDATSLVKASPAEVEVFEEIQKKLQTLDTRDVVYLDVGPPNYVRTVLQQHQTDPMIARALTSTCTIAGWTDAQHAVIRYSDGRKFRINKKYLTIPKKFDVKESSEDCGLSTISEIHRAIECCVESFHEQEEAELSKKSFSVELYSLVRGQLPTFEFRIRSTLVTSYQLCERLGRDYGWDFQEICDGIYTVEGFQTSTQKVKLVFLYNDDVFLSNITSRVTLSGTSQSTGQSSSTSEGKQREMKKEKDQPRISDVGDFKFLHLHDESLSRTVYFPYIVRGPARLTEAPENSAGESKRKGDLVPNIHGSSRGQVIF